MPYRLGPRNKKLVQEFKNGKWITLKKHSSEKKALKHVQALSINVHHKK